jgi:hypothetical protein
VRSPTESVAQFGDEQVAVFTSVQNNIREGIAAANESEKPVYLDSYLVLREVADHGSLVRCENPNRLFGIMNNGNA